MMTGTVVGMMVVVPLAVIIAGETAGSAVGATAVVVSGETVMVTGTVIVMVVVVPLVLMAA